MHIVSEQRGLTPNKQEQTGSLMEVEFDALEEVLFYDLKA